MSDKLTALKFVQQGEDVTTEHLLNTSPESTLLIQHSGHLKRKLNENESSLEFTLKSFTTKTEATLPAMKLMFDSFICKKDFNNTELTTNQTLWLKIGTEVFCNTTDNFMPTPTTAVETCTAVQEAPSSFVSDEALECLFYNQINGSTDNSNCEGL